MASKWLSNISTSRSSDPSKRIVYICISVPSPDSRTLLATLDLIPDNSDVTTPSIRSGGSPSNREPFDLR